MDLAVGEPYAGAETLMYDGGVQILFGKRAKDQNSLEEGFTLKCEESPCGLGNGTTIKVQSDWESGREYLVP